MKLLVCAALAAACVALSGCQTPYVTPKLISLQSRVDTVHDWELLAGRMLSAPPPVRNTRHAVREKYFLDTVDSTAPVYIQPAFAPGSEVQGSPFSQAFRQLLEERLYNAGYDIATSPRGAQILSFSTQTFLYNARDKDSFFYHAIPWVAVAGVASAVHDITSVDTGIAAAAIAAPVYDTLDALDNRTHTELFVTMKVYSAPLKTGARKLVFMRTEPLYIRRHDLKFYRGDDLVPTRLSAVDLPAPGADSGWGY